MLMKDDYYSAKKACSRLKVDFATTSASLITLNLLRKHSSGRPVVITHITDTLNNETSPRVPFSSGDKQQLQQKKIITYVITHPNGHA